MKYVKLFVTVLSLALLIAACTQSDTSPETARNDYASPTEDANANSTPEVLDDVAQGKKHYTEQCVKCHKEDGKGGPVEIEGRKLNPEDLTSAKMVKEPDEEYIEYITKGIKDEGMPAFKDILTDDEIKQVVKYIRADLQK